MATNVFDKQMLHELTDVASGVSARFGTGEGDRSPESIGSTG
jgi:hypothetical protein